MLKSMTGYGRASLRVGNTDLSVEINAVNRRGLEVFVSGPEEWTGLERVVTPWVREKCERGKVAVSVRVQAGASETASFSWDREAVSATLRRLEREALDMGMPFAGDSHLMLRLAELHRARRELRGKPGHAFDEQPALRQVPRLRHHQCHHAGPARDQLPGRDIGLIVHRARHGLDPLARRLVHVGMAVQRPAGLGDRQPGRARDILQRGQAFPLFQTAARSQPGKA